MSLTHNISSLETAAAIARTLFELGETAPVVKISMSWGRDVLVHRDGVIELVPQDQGK